MSRQACAARIVAFLLPALAVGLLCGWQSSGVQRAQSAVGSLHDTRQQITEVSAQTDRTLAALNALPTAASSAAAAASTSATAATSAAATTTTAEP
jgi:hypothetical protein